MQVSALHVFPVKSLRGQAVQAADVERQGLRHDRRWMLVDAAGEKINAARHPVVFSVTASPRPDGSLDLRADGRPDLHVPVPVDGPVVPVALARVGTAVGAGQRPDDWLSAALGLPVHLVWLADPAQRPVSGSHGGLPGDVLSLADTGPLLLTSAVSLRRLERWAAQGYAERYASCSIDVGTRPAPLAMERFRPNLVVDGDLAAFVEDTWDHVRVGEVLFRVSELCDRCAVPGIDPGTGRIGTEPLRSLARHRRREGRTWFGVRLVPLSTGQVRVGDPVTATLRTPFPEETEQPQADPPGPAVGQVAFDG